MGITESRISELQDKYSHLGKYYIVNCEFYVNKDLIHIGKGSSSDIKFPIGTEIYIEDFGIHNIDIYKCRINRSKQRFILYYNDLCSWIDHEL